MARTTPRVGPGHTKCGAHDAVCGQHFHTQAAHDTHITKTGVHMSGTEAGLELEDDHGDCDFAKQKITGTANIFRKPTDPGRKAWMSQFHV
jgi:hypothetical protein